jgi:hypothetical protein
VGLVGDQTTEITVGLQPGELVVLPAPPAGASEGRPRDKGEFSIGPGPGGGGPGGGPVMKVGP